MSELMEDVTTTQLADAIRTASEEVPWVPEDGAHGEAYYRQVALRVQGHLRRSGTIGRVDQPTIDRVSAALARVRARDAACTGAVT